MGSSQSIQYTLKGEILPLDELYNGKPFFRKYQSNDSNEKIIYRILSCNQKKHPNIVEIYRITEKYVDIEILDNMKDMSNLKDVMEDVKRFLHKNNIVYLDWKPDNIGIDKQGNFKLFDFDMSGVYNCDNEWVFEPLPGYVKRNAPDDYTPTQIDDWAFNRYIKND